MARLTFYSHERDQERITLNDMDGHLAVENVTILEFDAVMVEVDGLPKAVITAKIDPATLTTLPPYWRLDDKDRLVREGSSLDDLLYRSVDVSWNWKEEPDASIRVTPEAATLKESHSGYRSLRCLVEPDNKEFLSRARGRTLAETMLCSLYEVRDRQTVSTGDSTNYPVHHGSVAAFKTSLGVHRASRLYAKWLEEIEQEQGRAKPKLKPGVRALDWGDAPDKPVDRYDEWKNSLYVRVGFPKEYTGRIGDNGLECSAVGSGSHRGLVFCLGVSRAGARTSYTDAPRYPKDMDIRSPLFGAHICDRQPDRLLFWRSIAGWHGVFCLSMRQACGRRTLLRQYMIPVFADREDMDRGGHPLALRGLSAVVADQLRKLPFGPSALAYFLVELGKELQKVKGPLSYTEDYGNAVPPTGHLVRQASDGDDRPALFDSSYYGVRSTRALSLHEVIKSSVLGTKHPLSAASWLAPGEGFSGELIKVRRKNPVGGFRSDIAGREEIEPVEVQPVANLRRLEI